MSEPKDDDPMVRVILTMRRDGKIVPEFLKRPEILPNVAGVLVRGILAHAQAQIELVKGNE